MDAGAQIPDFDSRILRPLRALRTRLRRHLLITGVSGWVVFAVTLAAVQLGLDRVLALGRGPRIVLLAAVVVALAQQLHLRLLRPLRVRMGLVDLAGLLERRDPRFNDLLTTVVSLTEPDDDASARTAPADSPVLIRAALEQSVRSFSPLSTDGVIRDARRSIHLAAGLLALGLVAWAGFARPDLFRIYLARNWLLSDAAWPSATRIVPEGFVDGRMQWPMGDEFTLLARSEGTIPRLLRVEFDRADGAGVIRDVPRRGERDFVLEYGPLASSLRLRFLIDRFGVDDRTEWYAVEAVERPALRDVQLTVEPPPYTRLPPYALAAGQRSADVLHGASVRLTATANKQLTQVELSSADQPARRLSIENSDRLELDLTPRGRAEVCAWQLLLTDAGGLTSRPPEAFSFRLLADPPPRVSLKLPGCGEMITPGAVLPLEVECDDALGLRSAGLLQRVRRAEGADEPPAAHLADLENFVPGQNRFRLQVSWPVLALALHPGDQLTLQVRAADDQPILDPPSSAGSSPAAAGRESPTDDPPETPPSNTGQSVPYTLRVVSPEELLSELGRRELEWRREFERIIEAQKRLNTEVLDLNDHAADESSPPPAAEYARAARDQRQLAVNLKTVRRQFEQILSELHVNQLAAPPQRRRLRAGILDPLARLIKTDVPDAADSIERLREAFNSAQAAELEQAQSRILQTLNEILASMVKWEGYNEAIELLREILRAQEEINRRTQRELEHQTERLFDTPVPSESQPSGQP